MSLNALEIGGVCEVLHRDLQGAVVQEIHSPVAQNRLVLRLRTPGQTHFLQIVIHGQMTRIGRIEKKLKSSKAPHPFVMLLRKELTGMRLESAVQMGGDRVVRLLFSRGESCASLVVELTSRHGNLFWIGTDERIVASFFVNRSHLRKLVPGEPYQSPFPHPQKGPIINRFENADDLEAEIERVYGEKEASSEQQDATQTIRRLLVQAGRRMRRLQKNLTADLDRARDAQKLETLGHVLKANLYAVKKGETSLETHDFEGNPVVIPLDPKLGPVANMEKLYKRSKRFGKASGQIEERLTSTTAELKSLKTMEEDLSTASTEQIEEMVASLILRFPFLKQQTYKAKGEVSERLPYREYAISGGRSAMVGRSAKDNDTLTLRYAKPFDLWLHVRGAAGSHVVVPMGRKEEPTPDMLVDAAHLAVAYSRFKNDTDVEVIYTRRRYVQKPKGAAPGSVRLLSEKTIQLRVEPERLKRIVNQD